MSTDFDVVCDKCKKWVHLGTRFTSGCTFGHGSNDTEGQKFAMTFITGHFNCDSLRILLTDALGKQYMTPSDYEEATAKEDCEPIEDVT